MKGIIFSELINWVEADFSPQLADKMIAQSGVPNDGAYTTGGYYPHAEALALLTVLSAMTERPVAELAREYGRFLAGRLAQHHPEFMVGQTDIRTFLQNVEPHIHSEVRKLYPEVKTPEVQAQVNPDGARVTYSSHRPFADVAHGLIEGFVVWFGEKMVVERLSTADDGTSAEFLISPEAA